MTRWWLFSGLFYLTGCERAAMVRCCNCPAKPVHISLKNSCRKLAQTCSLGEVKLDLHLWACLDSGVTKEMLRFATFKIPILFRGIVP